MYYLSNFKLRDMVECGAVLRGFGDDAATLGEVADRTVRHLYESLVDANGGRSCALVRFFKTHRYGDLDVDLREFVDGILGHAPGDESIPCLTLLGTAGDRSEWNRPGASIGHRAIPLASEQMIDRFPMISQLLKQLGVDVASVIRPAPDLLVDVEEQAYNVFHVPDAAGSPHIPAQEDFVRPNRIRSVLGFGGILPAGELFTVILFSKVAIPAQTARLFTTVALNVKFALLNAVNAPLFTSPDGP